jgi:amino acid permease
MKSFILALAVLVGTIIGAGIFGLPYVVSKSGVLPSFFYFIVLGIAALLVQLIFGEIVLRTEGKLRIVGYAQKYFGRPGKILITVSTVIGLVGSLLAYGILAGDFLEIAFSSSGLANINLSSFTFTLIFLSGLSFFIFRGLKTIAPAEIFTNIVFFLIIFVIFFIGLPKLNFDNFFLINTDNLFLPYGVVMFSLIGWMAIPEINDMLKSHDEKRNLKKIIIIAASFCALLYLCFSLVVFGISGKNTSIETLQGLVPFLGTKIIFFGALAAVVTLIDSFLIIGLSLRNTLIYDLKLSKFSASSIVCGLPIILFLAGFQSFIGTIGFMGTILGAVDGIMIVLIYQKAKKDYSREPEYSLRIPGFLIYFLVLVFILGAVAQVLNYI